MPLTGAFQHCSQGIFLKCKFDPATPSLMSSGHGLHASTAEEVKNNAEPLPSPSSFSASSSKTKNNGQDGTLASHEVIVMLESSREYTTLPKCRRATPILHQGEEALSWALEQSRFDKQTRGGSRVTENSPHAQRQALSSWSDAPLQSTFQSCWDQ